MMDPKKGGIVLLMAAAFFTGACSASSEQGEVDRTAAVKEGIREGDKSAAPEESGEVSEEETESVKEETENGEEGVKSSQAGMKAAGGERDTKKSRGNDACGGGREEYTGILGHVKEVRGDRVLVTSDTDEFPGVFWVLGAAEIEEFGGGDSVFVLMEDTGQRGEDEIAEYKAVQMYQAEEDSQKEHPDVLPESAPALEFSDVLSSVWAPFSVQSGSYSWNTEETGIVACVAAPLDESWGDGSPRLKIPRYNGMDGAMYSCRAMFEPDKMAVRQWDVGDAEAGEERLIVYYHVPFVVELERGKIYEFSLEWKKENLKDNGFWGTAEYVFVTE